MGMIGNSLAQGLISGANIQDGTVDTPDIKDSAVTAAKIASAVITPGKLTTGAPTWDSSSNVGIGTAATSAFKLDVAGTVNAQGLQASGTASLSFGASKWMVQNEGSSVMRSYACGADTSTYGVWEHYTAKSNGTPVMVFRADALGNLGLGIAPSTSWGVPFRVIQSGSSSYATAIGFQTNDPVINLFSNIYYDGGGYKYINSGQGGSQFRVGQNGGVAGSGLQLNVTTSTGTAGGTASLVQALLVASNRSVVIGSTAADDVGYPFNGGNLQFEGSSIYPWTANGLYIQNNAWYNGTNWKYKANGVASQLTFGNNGGLTIGTAVSGTAGSNITFTEYQVLTNAPGTQSSFNSNIQMAANTRYKIGQLPQGFGTYAILITMDGGTNTGGGRIYWECAWGAVIGSIGSNIYNAGGPNALTVNGMDHYRSVAMPTFDEDSDGGIDGNYGYQSIFVTFPQTTNVENLRFYYKRLL